MFRVRRQANRFSSNNLRDGCYMDWRLRDGE
jgi:hypothetical protein